MLLHRFTNDKSISNKCYKTVNVYTDSSFLNNNFKNNLKYSLKKFYLHSKLARISSLKKDAFNN